MQLTGPFARPLPSCLALAAMLALSGCPAPVHPPGQIDANRPDAGRDGGARDANADANEDAASDMDSGADAALDTGVDGGDPIDSGADSPSADDTGLDANADAYNCVLPDGGGFDFCACEPPVGADCSSGPGVCPSGQTCQPDRCGMHCAASGAACNTDMDCPAGATCDCPDPAAGCMIGFCRGTPCTDSRTCPLGFACESGGCVNRRILCGTESTCPFGYVCNTALSGGTCVRVMRHCDTTLACTHTLPDAQQCVDVDGDGTGECQLSAGPCLTNADCSMAGTCTPRAIPALASCGRFGPCRTAADCLGGQECRDLFGDGIRECVDPGGCTNTMGCPAGQVCATPSTGGPPACLSRG